MRRLVAMLITLFCMTLLDSATPTILHAVPAAPDEHEVRLSDGTSFKSHRWGDENISGWETRDGYTVLFDEQVNDWTYAVHDPTGKLVSSKHRLAGGKPPAHMKKRLRPHGKGREGRRTKATSREPARAVADGSGTVSVAASVPSRTAARSGTGYIPVLLVRFSDTSPTYSTSVFNSLLFGSGTWSLSDYYTEVSYGRFTVDPGPAGVRGWYTAAHPHDYYGQNDEDGYDQWPGDLVYEAVQAADTEIDFSPYDQDGDCRVDVVAIVHQGTGEEASPKDTDIWSHRWTLSDARYFDDSHFGAYMTNDRCDADPSRFVTVDDYIMQPEKYSAGISTVGVFAHEYGHVLGLPDLYDTDYSSNGIGVWSVMAHGEWNSVARGGDRPGHPDAWCKSRLGWVAPQRITSSKVGATLGAASSVSDVLQVRYGSPDGTTGEYFLLEDRQRSGFDAGLPGSGLMVWHVDESKDHNDDEWHPGCPDCTSHYKVALLQADNLFHLEIDPDYGNRGDVFDPFPGGTNKRFLGDDTMPDNALYSGLSSGFSLANISDSAATMTLDIVMTDTVAPVTTISVAPPAFGTSRSGSFTFSTTECALFDCTLDSVPHAPCTSPFQFFSLPDGDHSFSVRATDMIGNVESFPPTHSWTIDTVPPDTVISAKPPGSSNSGYGSFSFSSSEESSVFECRMDNGGWGGCANPYAFNAFNDGSHTFRVRSIDRAGNIDPTPAKHDWTIAVTAQEYVKLMIAGLPDVYYPTVGAAMSAVPAQTAVFVRVRNNVDLTEDVVLALNSTVVLSGGYDATFSGTLTPTRIQGSLMVSRGILIAENLSIY